LIDLDPVDLDQGAGCSRPVRVSSRRSPAGAAGYRGQEPFMPEHTPKVGAPDPELKTSPILDEDEELLFDAGAETGVCYFNNVPYPIGKYVLSGSELLRCEEGGVWVRKGEAKP
jgi:hypothetical protein